MLTIQSQFGDETLKIKIPNSQKRTTVTLNTKKKMNDYCCYYYYLIEILWNRRTKGKEEEALFRFLEGAALSNETRTKCVFFVLMMFGLKDSDISTKKKSRSACIQKCMYTYIILKPDYGEVSWRFDKLTSVKKTCREDLIIFQTKR